MEIKKNDATYNRPDGERVVDAPFVQVDIPDLIMQLQDENAWQKNDRNGITVFKSENLTIVLTAFKAGAEINDNAVAGFMTLQVVSGDLMLSIEDEDVALRSSQLVSIHPGLKHRIKAVDDSVVLITTWLR